nr:DNA repair protein REV1 isoform X1 [Tanacetum cinerariifolium]
MKDCQHFLLSLCKEVSLRLHGCGVSGRTFTLKIKKRKTDEEPVKYMGCGDCDNLSHSLTVPMATDDVDVLQRITNQLFSHFHIDVEDIRGVGLHVTKLECADNFKQGSERSSIRSWLVSASVPQDKDTKEQFSDQFHRSKSKTVGAITSNQEDNQSSGLPSSPSGFDPDYLKCLPPEIISEYNEFYGGKLINFISKHRN